MSTEAANRRHFDRWAREYEDDPVSRRLADLQRQALDALGLTADDRLLDVGCGSGAAVRTAAPRVASAVGLDLSAGMVSRAQELAAGIPNVIFREGDVEALPFADGSFTALLCTTSFHHYARPGVAVGEMARVLAPGGRVVIADMVADRRAMRIADAVLRRTQSGHVGIRRTPELTGLLHGAGLVVSAVRPRLDGCYAIAVAVKPHGGVAVR